MVMYWHMARTLLLKTLVDRQEEKLILRAARKRDMSASKFLRYSALIVAEKPVVNKKRRDK